MRQGVLILHVPDGTAIAMSVETMAFPRAGTTVISELYRSYPAANALPRVGALPFGDRSWTCSGGGASDVAKDVMEGNVAVACCKSCDAMVTGVGVARLSSVFHD